MSALAFVSILGLLSTAFFPEAGLAHASTFSNNTLVIIAIDATRKGCTTTYRANINTSHPTVIRSSCPAGTVMTTELVPLTQATKMHVPYVLPANPNASYSIKSTTTQEVRNMMQKAGQKLLASSSKNMASPLTPCGGNGEWGVNWSPDGTTNAYSSTVMIYRSSDCSAIYFTQSRIIVNYHTYCDYQWINDAYAGNWYTPTGEPVLNTTGYLYSYNVNQSAPQGYYYENWVTSLASAPNCIAYYNYYVDIGPIS